MEKIDGNPIAPSLPSHAEIPVEINSTDHKAYSMAQKIFEGFALILGNVLTLGLINILKIVRDEYEPVFGFNPLSIFETTVTNTDPNSVQVQQAKPQINIAKSETTNTSAVDNNSQTSQDVVINKYKAKIDQDLHEKFDDILQHLTNHIPENIKISVTEKVITSLQGKSAKTSSSIEILKQALNNSYELKQWLKGFKFIDPAGELNLIGNYKKIILEKTDEMKRIESANPDTEELTVEMQKTEDLLSQILQLTRIIETTQEKIDSIKVNNHKLAKELEEVIAVCKKCSVDLRSFEDKLNEWKTLTA